MLEVYFKLLNDVTDISALRQWQCSWLEGQWLAKQKVLVALDAAELNAFDRLLWVFKDAAVVPHTIVERPAEFKALNEDYPIGLIDVKLLEASQKLIGSANWILNDSLEAVPASLPGKVLEPVPNIASFKERQRQRYRDYCAKKIKPQMLGA